MALILSNGGKKRIIKVGRIAGQYAKPRTSDYEIVNGKRIFSFRGDMVNGLNLQLNTENQSSKNGQSLQ